MGRRGHRLDDRRARRAVVLRSDRAVRVAADLEPVAVSHHRHRPRSHLHAAPRRVARRRLADLHRHMAAAQRNAHLALPRFVAAHSRGARAAHDVEGGRAADAAERIATGTPIMNELTNTRIRVSGQLVAGLVLAGLGVLFTLDNLHLVRAREVLRYWPAILLFVGVSQVLQSRSSAGMIGGSIWILIGGVLLGQRLNLISNALRFWPLVLVAIGAYVVWQSMNRRE